jgi:lysophospholipase L1-like esterase
MKLPALLATLLVTIPVLAHAEDACPPGRNPPLSLPHARLAMQQTEQLQIVALGSSTTFGWMASSPANAYPAQLQADLGEIFPRVHVNVLNRGIGGQDAAEEVLRIDSDAIAPKPSIVIWQVGANGALEHSDPAVFKKLVKDGVDRMKAAGIDVVLMDNQRSPLILASPDHAALEAALAEMAREEGVALFSRGALMDQWQKNGVPYARFIASDNLHQNDYGYRCLAAALAQSMAEGLRG